MISEKNFINIITEKTWVEESCKAGKENDELVCMGEKMAGK